MTLLLLSMPSMMKLFCVIGWPWALKPLSRSRLRVAGMTPAVCQASCWKFRPLSGRSRIWRWSTTCESDEVSDCRRGASVVTVTVSATPPTSRRKSARTRDCAWSAIAGQTAFLNPVISTATS